MYCECEYGDGRLPLLFIVNPAAHSGEGYALWKQAEAVLQERSIPYEVYFSEKRGDVRQLAKRLTNVSEGADWARHQASDEKAAGWRHRASDGSWMRHMEC